MATSASGQSPPPATTAPAEPLLSGPSVEEASGRKTLVQREFGGALVRLEERAEIAAIKLLELDAEQSKPVDALVSERARAVSDLTFKHLDLYLELQSARQSGTLAPGGDAAAQRELGPKIREMREYAAPMRRSPSRPGACRARWPASKHRRGGEALARALSAVVSDRREQFDRMIAAVNATPEQAEQVQRILREGSANAGSSPSSEQRAATARKIMDVLTPEQPELWRKARQGG